MLFDWISSFKSTYPKNYYWIYPNGLLVEGKHLNKLSQLGIDEIRFNTAATCYDHPQVMENLVAASYHIPIVTVEITSVPEEEPRLLSSRARGDSADVKYLNMHELMYGSGTLSENLQGERETFRTGAGYAVTFNP